MFAQHNKFGIMLQVDKKFLNYHLKTAETLAKSARETAEKAVSPEAAARAARMAAAAKEKAKAKQAAATKAKAKASEKEERCLLAEAVKVAAKAAKAAKVEAEEVEAAKSKTVKPELEPAKEQDGTAKAAKPGAAKAEATAEATEAEAARLGAEATRLLVQARSSPVGPATHHARSYVFFLMTRPCPLICTGASGAEEGPDHHGGRRPADACGCPARGRQQPFWNAT